MFWQIFLESLAIIGLTLLIGGIIHRLVHSKKERNKSQDS